ncbi:hypothetical protein HPP92_007147 [Vanilla planifolia]|uniref:Uncharacterized protein n=1 Tax=Vanilla planifolia TaxID=51239 RepID=A0A835V9T1_VANPL|nr:hypothetical protein HPP92_007147 [Vanilla planifolia]
MSLRVAAIPATSILPTAVPPQLEPPSNSSIAHHRYHLQEFKNLPPRRNLKVAILPPTNVTSSSNSATINSAYKNSVTSSTVVHQLFHLPPAAAVTNKEFKNPTKEIENATKIFGFLGKYD